MKKSKRIILLLTSLILSFVLLSVVAFAADEVDHLCGNPDCNNEKCVWVEESRDGCYVKFILQCPICRGSYDGKYEYNHDFQEYSRIDATCKAEGRVFYACEAPGCLETKSEVLPLDPDAHNYCAWIPLTSPTCNVEGTKYRVCTNYTEDSEGKKQYCDKRQDGIVPVDDNAHIFDGEWERTAAPTCETPGEEKTICTVCNKKEATREIPAHTDTLSDTVFEILSEPSCIRDGSMKCVCVKCNANVTVVLPKSEDKHSWILKETVPAACEAEGLNVYTCQWHIDVEKTETIPVTGHSFKNYVSDNNATCESDGTKTAKCEGCDKKDTVADAGSRKQHVSGSWIIISGDCTKGGTALKKCIFCHTAMSTKVDFPANTHLNLKNVTVEATCSSEGYKAEMCMDCGFKKSREVLPLAHVYPDEWTVVKAASCSDEGLRTKECKKCHQVKEEVIAKLDHKYMVVAEGLEATCLQDGYTDKLVCMTCYETKESVVLPKLGHNDSDNNGSCNRCYVYFIETENGTVDCKCIGHNPDGLAKFVFKFMVFFYKLFGMKQYCDCGALHYE